MEKKTESTLPVKADYKGAVGTMRNLHAMLEDLQPQISRVLPRHITAERLLRVAQTAVTRNPKLMQCTAMSVVGCIMASSELGLELNGPLGEAYAVPFQNKKTGRTEAQFIAGYPGLLKLVRNSGDIANIQAAVVYEKDTYEFERGLEPKLRHIESQDADRGLPVATYAVAIFRDGSKQYEWLWESQIQKIRDKSRARDNGPWADPNPIVQDWMRKKSVLRQLVKLLPKSVEKAQRIAALDELADADIPQHIAADYLQLTDNTGGGVSVGNNDPLDAIADEINSNGKGDDDAVS